LRLAALKLYRSFSSLTQLCSKPIFAKINVSQLRRWAMNGRETVTDVEPTLLKVDRDGKPDKSEAQPL